MQALTLSFIEEMTNQLFAHQTWISYNQDDWLDG
jgi:hypothetical protein